MTTIKQALAELEGGGFAVYHNGTPVSGAYITIDGTHYDYNKFKDERMSIELRKAIKTSYDKFKQLNNNISTQDGHPSVKNCLNYLLENGHAEHVNVKWGNGHRNVIIIEGKKYQYKGGDAFNKNLENTISALYISMSNKASNKNTYRLTVKEQLDKLKINQYKMSELT